MNAVVFSSRAYNAIVAEAIDKDPVETGGILLGHMFPSRTWVVTDVVPPGGKSINKWAYFEYDEFYVNYTANVTAKQYQIPPRVLGLWHRHPGSMDVFSTVDDGTNIKFAALNGEYGAISCLVNFDPEFRLTVYRVTIDETGLPIYEKVPFLTGDEIIPEKYFQLRYYRPEEQTDSEEEPQDDAPAESDDDSDEAADNVYRRNPTAAFPTTLEENYVGPLYGIYSPETNYFNFVAPDSGLIQKVEKIGYVFEESPFKDASAIQFQNDASGIENGALNLNLLMWALTSQQGRSRFSVSMLTDSAQTIFREEGLAERSVLGYRNEQGLVLVSLLDLKECVLERYSLKLDVFSRNVGILESDVMLSKKAVLIGCGSVGSLAALELARSGVGHFLLIDSDILGYHNLCRHQCGALDVGRYKTDCLKDRIEQINPYAEVLTVHDAIERAPLQLLNDFCNENTVFIGGADNREGDLYACELAKGLNSAFISIGCWERAHAGEIFYCLPTGMPDYSDYLKCIASVSQRVTQNRRFYTTEAELEKVSFEPGIAVDIDFITIIAVKLALDILNRDNPNYTPRAINRLTELTFICNTCTEDDMWFNHPLTISTNLHVSTENTQTSESGELIAEEK